MDIGYELYIGSNNLTGELEIARIEEILKLRHSGYTIKGIVTGYWEGREEDTLVVLVADLEEVLEETIEILKTELDQDSIMAIEVGEVRFF